MKLKKQFAYVFFLTFFINLSFSQQVDVTIENMIYISGTAINNCDTIDFEDNTTVRIQFNVKLEKPSSLLTGNNSYLRIYTKKTSSDFPNSRFSQQYQEINWSFGNPQSINTPIDITLNASDFNVNGGVLYAEFEYTSGTKRTSCNYSIEKDQLPEFNISPTQSGVNCGYASSSLFTFSAVNVHNSPGSVIYSGNGLELLWWSSC